MHHVCHKNHINLIGQAWQLASASASFNTNVNFTSKHPKGRCEPWFRDWLDTGWVTWFCANPSKPVYRSYSDPTCTCVQRPSKFVKSVNHPSLLYTMKTDFYKIFLAAGWVTNVHKGDKNLSASKCLWAVILEIGHYQSGFLTSLSSRELPFKRLSPCKARSDEIKRWNWLFQNSFKIT